MIERRRTVPVNVSGVLVGGNNPIVVQSMTNTDTVDVDATALQVEQLARAGSELVRITVNTLQRARADQTPRATSTNAIFDCVFGEVLDYVSRTASRNLRFEILA